MNFRHTIVAAVVLVALGAWVFFFERGKAPEEGSAGTLASVLGLRKDDVWKVQIDRPEDPLWLVRQKDGRGELWKLEKPLSAVADAEEARRIVGDVADATVDRMLREDVKDLKPFGLDKPAWELTLATDDGTTRTLLVGGKDPGGSNLYLKRKDRPEVLVVSSYAIDGLQSKQADELRDKTVIAFDKERVQSFELTSGGKTIRVERAGTDQWRITQPVKAKARTEKVNSILMSFQSLKGSKIIEDAPKDLKQYGLQPAEAKVAVWVRGEKEPRVGLLGKKDSSGDVYAKAEQNPAVVTVYSYVLSDAQSKLEDIREPEPVKEEKKPEHAPANSPAANAPAKLPTAGAPPSSSQPAAEEPGPTLRIDKPIPAKKPADKKPAAKKPAAKEPAAKKPAGKKP